MSLVISKFNLGKTSLSPLWRSLTFLGLILLSFTSYKFLDLSGKVPVLLFISLFPIFLAFPFYICKKSWDFPGIPFLTTFFIFMAVFIDSFTARTFGISPKANQLFFFLSGLFTIVYLIRYFKYFFQFLHIKLSLVFFILTFLYFLFYASDFDISRVKYGYVLLIGSGMEINSPPVRFIILTSSIGILVASVLALAPFKAMDEFHKKKIENLLQLTYSLLAVSLLLVVLGILSKAAKFNFSMHCYLPLMLTAGFSFLYFVRKYHFEARFFYFPFRLRSFLFLSLIITSLFLPLALNKTSLFSAIFVFIVFFWLTRGCGYGDLVKKAWRVVNQDILLRIMISTCAFLIIFLSATLGIFELFSEKIDYVIRGLSKGSSMKVREGNWEYFLQYWWNSLNVWHIISGYGIGASRKTIFFISAMRDNANEHNLVQTVHNSYVEYLYDYGLTSLFYFWMYFVFLKKIFYSFFNKENHDERVLAASQLACILFTAIYGLTDGIRVQMLIQLFVLLGFLEVLKNYYLKHHLPMLETV